MVSPISNKIEKEEFEVKIDVIEREYGGEKEEVNDGTVALNITGATGCEGPPPDYSVRDPLNPEGCGSRSTLSTGDEDDSFWEANDSETSSKSGSTDFSELSVCGKLRRIFVHGVGKFLALLALLYLFVCSLDLLSSAFRLLGGKAAGSVFSDSELLRNPVVGLMIGIIATVLVQSSSTSTSITITMVASGIIDVIPAIPIIMGANIGTSVTNTLVALAQSGDRNDFRRAFAAATIHDMFNWLSVILLLPIEVTTGYLYRLTSLIVESLPELKSYSSGKKDMLKVITKPFTSLIIKVDKKVIEKLAAGHTEYSNKSLIKTYCTFDEVVRTITVDERNNTLPTQENVTRQLNITEKIGKYKCVSLFSHLTLSDSTAGIILLVVSLAVLCTCLVLLVKLLHSMLKGHICKVVKKIINANFPGKLSWLTGYVAIIIGAGLTIVVQSSSVFTSALTPLVGVGMVKLERMYPLTLGSNVGTTATGLLASLASSGDRLPIALQIALCHLFFNISGILVFYPVPFMRKIPINLAKKLGTITSKYRWFSVLYIISMFLLLPLSVFTLCMSGPTVTAAVGIPILLLFLFIVIVNFLQIKHKSWLPVKLQNWDFLPKCLHSLEPLDRSITKLISIVHKSCPCCKPKPPKPNIRHPVGALPFEFDDSPYSSRSTSILLKKKSTV